MGRTALGGRARRWLVGDVARRAEARSRQAKQKLPAPLPYPAEPGWYASGGERRWWDGMAWTEHTAPLQPPVDRA